MKKLMQQDASASRTCGDNRLGHNVVREGYTMKNDMKLCFANRADNEAFARVVIGAFIARLDPVLSEMEDVKTAVSEAVTNAIVHGYGEREGYVELSARVEGRTAFIEVADSGCGIEDVERARQPFYTSKPEQERSGMGFTVMEAFMDRVEVESEAGRGTRVRMEKTFSGEPQ